MQLLFNVLGILALLVMLAWFGALLKSPYHRDDIGSTMRFGLRMLCRNLFLNELGAAMVAPGQFGPKNQIYDAATAAGILQQGYDINSLMAGWVDRGAWTYYDRVIQPLSGTGSTYGGSVGQLAQVYSPFSVGLNKPDPITGINKTKLWTNLPNSGQFNPPRCLVLQRLGVYFEPSMLPADIFMVAQNAYFEFKIDDKIFFEGLLEFHPSGAGFVGYVPFVTNGTSNPHATRSFGNYAKYIAPLQNFFFTVTFPSLMPVTNSIGGTTPGTNPGGAPTLSSSAAGGTGLNMVFMMDGLTDRSVQ